MNNIDPPPLPQDVWNLIAKLCPTPALSLTDKNMNKIVNKIFTQASKSIIKELPSLNGYPEKIISKQPINYFMELVGLLINESDRLNIKNFSPSNLSINEKVVWEYQHYGELVKALEKATASAQIEDFSIFLNAVADAIGIAIEPSDKKPNEVWQELIENPQIKEIEELNLHDKKLKFLPPQIGALSNLKKLHLAENNLRTIPKEIGLIKKLERFYLDNNKLEFLPKELILPKLKYLELRHNKLKNVPDLKNFPKLLMIYLHGNQIEEIPLDDINSHEKLKKIYLQNNPLKEKPQNLSKRIEIEEPILDFNFGNNNDWEPR